MLHAVVLLVLICGPFILLNTLIEAFTAGGDGKQRRKAWEYSWFERVLKKALG